MIRNNLSTRPFYNERAVHAWLLALLLVTAAATVFNVWWVVRYTRDDAELATVAARDEGRTAEARTKTAQLRSGVDTRQIEYAFEEARQTNELIDRRTFSWTGLLNQFETTLPDDVRITAVRPRLDAKRGMVLTINVVARRVEDVDQFMQRLDGTGAFADLLSTDEHFDDDGLLLAALVTTYVAPEPPNAERGKRP